MTQSDNEIPSLPRRKRANWRYHLLTGGLSLAAIVLMLSLVDLNEMGDALQQVILLNFVLSIIVVIVTQFLQGARWYVLLVDQISLWRATTVNFIGNLVSALTPLRFGEVVKMGLARQRYGVALARSLSSIALAQLLDLLALVMLGFVLLLFVPLPPEIVNASLVVGVIGIILLVGIWLSLRLSDSLEAIFQRTVGRLLNAALLDRLRGLYRQFQEGLAALNNRSQFLYSVGLTLIFWILTAVANWILMFGLVKEPTLWMGLAVAVSSGIGRLIPALPGSIGTADVAITVSLITLGLSDEVALTVALLVRLRFIIMIVLTGLLGIFGERGSIADIQQISN